VLACLSNHFVELGRLELLTRIDLLFVMGDFVEVGLQGQVVVICLAAARLTAQLKLVDNVNNIAHAALALKQQSLIVLVRLLHLGVRKSLVLAL